MGGRPFVFKCSMWAPVLPDNPKRALNGYPGARARYNRWLHTWASSFFLSAFRRDSSLEAIVPSVSTLSMRSFSSSHSALFSCSALQTWETQ